MELVNMSIEALTISLLHFYLLIMLKEQIVTVLLIMYNCLIALFLYRLILNFANKSQETDSNCSGDLDSVEGEKRKTIET